MRIPIETLRAPLYLMPLTVEAVLLYHILENQGITASGFLDNNEILHGKAYRGCVITYPGSPDIAASNATVVLCSKKYYQINRAHLYNLGYRDILMLDQILKEEDAIDAIEQIDIESLYALNPRQTGRLPLDAWHYKRHYMLPDSALGQDKLVLDKIELVVTEKCTLKCKGCANLMQYFKKPRHLELEDVCSDLDTVMKNVDFVRNLNLIGGEPLLYNQLPKVIEHIMRYREKISTVTLVTNGTVIPTVDMLQGLKAAEAVIEISVYGSLSSHVDELIQALSDTGIMYRRQMEKTWRDVQRLVTGDTTNAQAKYEQCTATCNTIKQGRFYRCPFLAHGDTLNAFPHDEENYVPLDETCMKEGIRSYLGKKQAPPGCGYCSGYTSNAPVIPLAEQIKSPLKYHVF